MNVINTKKYSNYIIIIISAIFLLEIISNLLNINTDLKRLITNFLFAILGLFILFGWELKIFILLNIFGFLKFNIGLITNNLTKPDLISGEFGFNLQMTRWIMTVVTFVIIIAGFQNQLTLGSLKDKIDINKKKILVYYSVGTFFVQLIIRLALG